MSIALPGSRGIFSFIREALKNSNVTRVWCRYCPEDNVGNGIPLTWREGFRDIPEFGKVRGFGILDGNYERDADGITLGKLKEIYSSFIFLDLLTSTKHGCMLYQSPRDDHLGLHQFYSRPRSPPKVEDTPTHAESNHANQLLFLPLPIHIMFTQMSDVLTNKHHA